MSGWIIKSKEIADIKIVDIRYLNKIFDLLLHKIVAKITIKNGFRTSMGWNLGKKYKSIHLFEPLTSTPIIGTKAKKIKDIINNGVISLISNSVFNIEIKIIINKAKNVKTRCLVKKK